MSEQHKSAIQRMAEQWDKVGQLPTNAQRRDWELADRDELARRAEEIERLTAEVKHAKSLQDHSDERIAALEELVEQLEKTRSMEHRHHTDRIAALEEALRFYANPLHYAAYGEKVCTDAGELARKTLSEHEVKDEG